MAKEGYVPVSFGYKLMTVKEIEELEGQEENEDYKIMLLSELIYLCTFGMENPIRPKVPEDVQLIKYGKKKSGDSKEGGE